MKQLFYTGCYVLALPVWLLVGMRTGFSQQTMAFVQQQVPELKQNLERKTILLRDALKLLEQQYNVDIVFGDRVIQGYSVSPERMLVKATLEENLNRLLEPAGLKYRKIGKSSFIILAKGDRAKQSKLGGQDFPQAGLHEHSENITIPGERQTASFLEKKIEGRVVSTGGELLPGVSIILKGTQRGTITDVNGKFSIVVPDENAVLVFSYVGHQTHEMVVGNKTSVDIKLAEDEKSLGEVVVIGYGTAKKSDLTGSVTRIKADDFRNQSMTQLSDMLTGTVAGFESNQGTTAAGGASMEIRGPNSLNAGTSPMIVLDGAVYNGSMRDINPNDIESIDILKDASSAAVFGARAASGVILITTKMGKTGKPTINFTSKFGLTKATGNYGPKNTAEYLDFKRAYFKSNNLPFPDYYWDDPNKLPNGVTRDQWRSANPNPVPDDTREYLSRMNFFPLETESYLEGKSVDWRAKVMPVGVRQEYDLNIAGGTENSKYYWSLGYVDNEGVVRGDKFGTIRSRLNVDFKISNWLNVGTNTQFSLRDEGGVPADLYQMNINSPYGKYSEEDGSLIWYPTGYALGVNPMINTLGQDRDAKTTSIFSSIYGQLTLPFGISFRVSYQPRIESSRDYNYWSPSTLIGGREFADGRAERKDFSSIGWMVDNMLKWNKKIGNHSFDLTLLHNAEQNRTWYSFQANNTFRPSPVLGFSGTQFGINPSLRADDVKITGDGLMARVNYSLMERYLFTASVRRDGFSAFGQKNPRAIFPAAAFAWILSRENFFKAKSIDFFKFRLSYGVNGNRDIGEYAALARLGAVQYYDGKNVQVGIQNSSLGNEKLAWEETRSINLGIDLEMYNRRLNARVDYYDMITRNLLVNRSLPVLTGFSDITTNIGELGNRGFELTIGSVNVRSSRFTWKTDVNFSMNRNRIISLFGDRGEYVLSGNKLVGELPDFTNGWFPGKSIDVVWNYKINGIWQESEREQASKYGLFPGDFKVEDKDKSNSYQALQDKEFIGYESPRFRIGIRNEFHFLENFSLSFFIRSDVGHIAAFPHAIHEHSAYDRISIPPVPYWTQENQSNDWPRLSLNSAVFGGGIMLYKPRSFVRLQDLSINYSVPSEIMNKVKIDRLQVFLSARNLATFTRWPGWDPESGINSPMPKMYTLGLNLSL